MSEQANLDRANQAKMILDSKGFKDAFAMVRESIIKRMESQNTDSETAAQLRACLLLLNDVKLNMETAVNSGKIEQFRMAEDEKRKKNPLRGLFR